MDGYTIQEQQKQVHRLFDKCNPPAVTIKIKTEVKQPVHAKEEKITTKPLKIVDMTVAMPTTHKQLNDKKKKTIKSEMKNTLYSGEITKHKMNITEIMRWSNATPIRRCGDMGYMCCHCEDQYLEPADLKKHTLQVHEDVTEAYFMKNMRMYQFVIKLDITDLQCKICNKSIDTTEELMQHLKYDHKKTIYTDIKNHIVPFKFNKKPLECFICKNVFNKFKLLLIHMNIHYRNYICEVCDAGFVNHAGVRLHQFIHKTGDFDCEFCTMKFETLIKKKQHIKTKHTRKISLHKCGYCKETFNDYRKKEVHLITAHGQKKTKSKCQACDKVFESSKHLAVHVKRDHLMERPHGCKVCEMTFFSKYELMNHMAKHSGERSYKCAVCLKSFGLAKTLKEHMRIHNDDRRFKCEHCGQGFVQKCSWRSHMRSKHGEIV